MSGSFRLSLFDPPADVGVVGFGFYTATVFDLLAESGQPVQFVVDDGLGADEYGVRYAAAVRGIPVLDSTTFVERARRGGILYAGRLETPPDTDRSGNVFRQVIDWTTRTVGKPIPVCHPVSLLGQRPPPPCPDRYAVFGYPGSGNVLTQSLIASLCALSPTPEPECWRMRATISEHYFHTVAAQIRSAVARVGPAKLDFISHEFGTMMVVVNCERGQTGVAMYVPSLRHLGLRTFGTHSRPTRQAVNHFRQAGVPCFAVIRHPLETLLSLANKIGRPSRAVLDSPRFLRYAAAGMTDWVRHLLDNRDRLTVVRYEDLAERKLDALGDLAAVLGRPAPADTTLFDSILFRNLPSAVPTHFHRGGSDKWRTEFTATHLRVALRELPSEAFTAFGYDVPTEADLLPTVYPPGAREPTTLDALLMDTYPYRLVPGPHGIRVTATSPELSGLLADSFQDPELLSLFAAGGLIDDSAVPAVYDAA